MDQAAAAEAIRAFLVAIEHPAEGELAQTPELVAQAWCEDLLRGYKTDPRKILEQGKCAPRPGQKGGGPVAIREMLVTMMCPHHLLPAHGRADLIYLPGESLCGIGAVVRALQATTERLVLQEDATQDFADVFHEVLAPTGVALRLRMHHTCLSCRGVRATDAYVESIAWKGRFAQDPTQRHAIWNALNQPGERP